MADTYYAWSKFQGHVDGKTVNIKVGDEIDPSKLGLDAESDDWKAYLENGTVRTQQLPDMGDFSGSPVEFVKAQLDAAANEGGFFDTQFGRVAASKPPEIDPETGKPPEVRQQPAVPTQPGPGGK